MIRRHIIDATPTLRGLLVAGDASASPPRSPMLYPWTHVGCLNNPSDSYWTAYNDNGELVTHENIPLLLRVCGTRETRTARNAQLRSIGQAWSDGHLCIKEQYLNHHRIGLFLILCLLLFSGIFCWFPVITIQRWPFDGITEYDLRTCVLFAVTALLMGLQIVIPIAMAIVFLHKGAAMRPNVIQAVFDSNGITATILNGDTIQHPWSDVQSINTLRLWSIIQFAQGHRLCFRTDTAVRTRLLLTIAQQQMKRQSIRRLWNAEYHALLRSGIYAMIGGVFAAVFCLIFAPEDRRDAGQACAACVAVAGILGGFALKLAGKPAKRRSRRNIFRRLMSSIIPV